MDNNIGKKLDGRYELLELIGVGGMADIYKAKDITEDRTVAVKIMKNEFIGSEDFIRRFRNESKAIALLSHPNIVKIFDVGFTEKLQFIVMEYIDGITLTDYITKHGVLKWKDVVHFTMQILKALQHAHDRGIVHRDIKPQNVMLLEDGTIKVMDFGIARFNRETDKTMSEKAIGSVHYISPEQAKGDVTDERSDIYSVGVMMYEMLTGKKPFDGESPVAIALMHMQSQAKKMSELNNSIPEGLEEITEKAMQKEPSKRYQTAGEMVKDIEEFKQNPSIVFEYKYFSTDGTTKYFDKVAVPENKAAKTTAQTSPTGEPRRGYALAEEEPEEEEDEDEEYDDEVAPRRSPLLSVLFAVTAVFVIVAAFVVYKLITDTIPISGNGGSGSGGNNAEDIVVPAFVGMTLDQVTAEYSELNLKIISQHDSAPEGQVIHQGTGAGTSIKPTQQITITVSLGPQMAEIDEFSSRPMEEAIAQLKNQGFKTEILRQADDTVPANYVIKTDPPARTRVEVGTTVTVYVSQGATPTLTTVPDFRNLTENTAKQNAERNDLILIITYGPSEDGSVAAGRVISQDIEPYEKVEKNTIVTLLISNGEIAQRESSIVLDITSGVTGKFKLEYYIDGVLLPSMTETTEISLRSQIKWEFKNTGVHTYAIVVTNPETGKSTTLIEVEIDFNTDPPTKENPPRILNSSAFTDLQTPEETTTTTTEPVTEPPVTEETEPPAEETTDEEG